MQGESYILKVSVALNFLSLVINANFCVFLDNFIQELEFLHSKLLQFLLLYLYMRY